MKILITGGTGFIGSRLALHCKNIGCFVSVIGLENTSAEKDNSELLVENGITVHRIDITEKKSISPIISGIDLVFHLAAAQHEINVPDSKFWDVNVVGTRNLLNACIDSNVKKLVHGSTIGVYGSLEGEIDENSTCRPDNIYGKSKLEAEKVIISQKDKIKVAVIRIPETYGPGDRRLIKLFKMINNNNRFTIGDGKNLHHCIYIDDLIEGLLLAVNSDNCNGEILLFSGQQAISTGKIYQTIADELGAHVPNIQIPYAPIYILACLSEMIFCPLGIQPPIYRRRIDFFRKSFSLSSKKAERLINFNPTTCFKDGINKTAGWYFDKGFIKKR